MEDLMEQANEVQESLGRSYNLPDDIDEADLEAGRWFDIWWNVVMWFAKTYSLLELDALGDDLNFEEEEVPSYLQEDVHVPTGLNENADVRLPTVFALLQKHPC